MQIVKLLSIFVFFFALECEIIFIETRTIKSIRAIGPGIIYCLQVRPCISQPGNFTAWGSEGVNSFLVVVCFWWKHMWKLTKGYTSMYASIV